MKTLPTKITHIATGAEFTPLSMNLGGQIKIKCTKPAKGLLIKKGGILMLDLDETTEDAGIWITPIGQNFI